MVNFVTVWAHFFHQNADVSVCCKMTKRYIIGKLHQIVSKNSSLHAKHFFIIIFYLTFNLNQVLKIIMY